MKIAMIIGGGIMAVMMVVVIGLVMWYFSICNTENALNVRFVAQSNVVENSMDNMRKTLMSQFSVTKEYSEAIIRSIMENQKGRVGGSFIKVTTEGSVQNISPELYSKMMSSIEGKLAEFERSQNVLNDVWTQHKIWCTTQPRSFILSGRVLPKPVMVTSSVSKKAMETGILEDNVIGK